MTPESFELLLRWLDPDRNEAGKKYEAIRHRLILFFTGRRCPEPEKLADDTIDRVAGKLPGLMKTYEGNPINYFYGVARKVYLEKCRVPRTTKLTPPPAGWTEPQYVCMEKCMEKLPPHKRRIFVEYHCNPKDRQKLADELGISLNALRIQVFRIRVELKACVEDCLEREGE